MFKVIGVNRVKAAENHRLHRLKAGQGFDIRFPGIGNGIAHAGVGNLFDGGGEIPYLTGSKACDML